MYLSSLIRLVSEVSPVQETVISVTFYADVYSLRLQTWKLWSYYFNRNCFISVIYNNFFYYKSKDYNVILILYPTSKILFNTNHIGHEQYYLTIILYISLRHEFTEYIYGICISKIILFIVTLYHNKSNNDGTTLNSYYNKQFDKNMRTNGYSFDYLM